MRRDPSAPGAEPLCSDGDADRQSDARPRADSDPLTGPDPDPGTGAEPASRAEPGANPRAARSHTEPEPYGPARSLNEERRNPRIRS